MKYSFSGIVGVAALCLAGAAKAAPGEKPVTTTPWPGPAQPTPVYHAPPPPPPTVPLLSRMVMPRGNPGYWVTTDDYPAEARRMEQEGLTGFRLTVSAEGLVTACEITASSGYSSLDEATCQLITERARFTPALDRTGRPTTGRYSNRVRWMLPYDFDRRPPRAGIETSRMTVAIDGEVGRCRITKTSGDLATYDTLGDSECPVPRYGSGYRDSNGTAVRRTVIMVRNVAINLAPVELDAAPTANTDLRLNSAPPLPGTIISSYIVEPDGRMTNCRIESVTGEATAQFRPGVQRCLFSRFIWPIRALDGEFGRMRVVETVTTSFEVRR